MNWKKVLASIPAGLSYSEVAARLGTDYSTTRVAIKQHRYKVADGRRFAQNATRILVPEDIDWRKPNIQIARELLISKQRVSFVRKQLGKAPVESRGRPRKP